MKNIFERKKKKVINLLTINFYDEYALYCKIIPVEFSVGYNLAPADPYPVSSPEFLS